MFNCDASFNLQLHQLVHITLFACLMVLSATFNNISVTSLSSDLLVEKIGVPGENYRPVASHSQTLSHSVVLSTHRHERGSNILPEKLQRNYTLSTCLFLVFNVEKYSIPIWLKIAILFLKRTAFRLKQLQFLFYL